MFRSDPRVRAALFVGALVLYIATATPGAFWLDSSELAAAGVTLGIPHAPGHPLYVLLAYAASLMPLGPVGFRVALLSALFGAVAVVLLYVLTLRLIAASDRKRPPEWVVIMPVASFAVTDALWFQSVRAEVYTLHLALALGVLLIAVDWRCSITRKPGPLLVGAFLLGLGLGNHHLLLFALVPALAITLLADEAHRVTVLRVLPMAAVTTVAGLLIYALLPLRAAHAPLVNYGHPDTLGRFADVVMAKVFTGSVTGAQTPFVDNVNGAMEMFVASLGPVWLLLAPAGWFLVWRTRRGIAVAIAVAVAANLATKLLMILDPTNPDAAGYFQLAMALTAAMGGVALAGLSSTGRGGRIATGLIAAAALMTLAVIWPAARTDLSDLRGPEILDTALHADAPPGALVMTSFFAHHFNGLYQRTVAGYRPDIHTVHQGLEDHIDAGRPFARTAALRDPALRPVLDAKLSNGAFPTQAILDHAAERPILMEPTFGLPIPAEHLRYRGGLFAVRVKPGPATPGAQADVQRTILSALGSEASSQRETLTTLSITWLATATSRLRQGSAVGAGTALDGVDEFSAGSRWVKALRRPTAALAAALASSDPTRIADVRAALQNTDFGSLFDHSPAP